MKKLTYAVLLALIVIVSFLVGSWYTQRPAPNNNSPAAGRKILYYVDPMNPAHTSDKPGIAPCGMKMEAVYADEGPAAGPSAGNASLPAGTVKVSPEKQQVIGVKVATVEKSPSSHTLRVLGRVVPDETRIYRINAATDGWVKKILPVTTGSLVKKGRAAGHLLCPGVFLGPEGLPLWLAIAGPFPEERQGNERAARVN